MTNMHLGFGLYRFREGADRLLTEYIRQGGRILDAAPNYSNGNAHSLIANNSEANLHIDDLNIWSKVGFAPCRAALQKRLEHGIVDRSELVDNHALSPRLIRYQIAETRTELNNLKLDAVYLHNPERQFQRLSHKQFWTLMVECIEELEKACAEGGLRRWGISTWDGFNPRTQDAARFTISEWEMAAQKVSGNLHHFQLVQTPLNLANVATVSDFVENQSGPIQEALNYGKMLVASSPMHGGELPPVLNNEFTELFGPDVSPGQACLLFLTGIPNISACLISPRTMEQLKDSLDVLIMPAPKWDDFCRVIHLLIGS
jgi:aryl-alcohol dehydrogenase-like predicted oxidoreductase